MVPQADRSRTPPDVVGQRVAHYEVESEIGRGGMGVVFRARDVRLGRHVALKCPWPEVAGHASVNERFLREARSAALLSHPNIVPVFEVLRSGGLPWIAMELVEGRSLRHLLRESGRVPVETAIRWAEALAHALHAAHEKGIVHRDINPNNVLLRAGTWPLITDFGLARTLADKPLDPSASTASDALTAEGQVVGTRHYMPPEQLLGRAIDHRADIFALGALLYEMCTGRRAFEAPDGEVAVEALLQGTPPSVSGLVPEADETDRIVNHELDRIVAKALARRPESRYQQAQVLAHELAALRSRLESAVYAPRIGRTWLTTRRALFGAGIVLVAGLAALAVSWHGRSPSPPPPLPVGTPRQVTSDPGWEADPALSPDGSLIAYTAGGNGNPDIWLTDLQGGSRLRLTDDTASDTSPTWFPDGSGIAFVSDRSGVPSVWRVPRLGGAAVLVAPNAFDPAVSPDGKRIAFARPNADGYASIVVARLDDAAQPRTITGPADGQLWQIQPTWSPDGQTLCYADALNLWLVHPDRGPARRLTRGGEGRASSSSPPRIGRDFAPTFSADGRSVVFSSFRDGTRALWRVSLAGGEPERMTIGSGPESEASISADGLRVAYSTYVDDYDVVVRDLRGGRAATIGSVLADVAPVIAPDDRAIVFASARRGGLQDLWLQKLTDGLPDGSPTRLTDLPGDVNTPSFSRDGRWIAFKRELDGRRETWVIPAAGGGAERFSDGTGGLDIQPAFSPDGRQIAFASKRTDGVHLYVAPVSDGRRSGPDRQLTRGDTTDLMPTWSPDGRQIAYLAVGSQGQQLRILPLDGAGAPRTAVKGPSFGRMRWDEASGALWYATTLADGAPRLMKIPRGGVSPVGASEPSLFEGAAEPGEFDLSTGGRLLAYTRREVRGDVWLLEQRGASRPGR